MPKLIALALALCASLTAAAQGFDTQLARAFAQIEDGDYDGAVQALNELKVDNPNSELIEYGLASALYAKAALEFEEGNREMASVSMDAAKKKFQALQESSIPEIRRDASLNAANSVAHIARDKAREYIQKFPVVRPEDYKTAEQSSREAVSAYESVLSRYPDSETAQTNLNHARYLLKSVQQRQPKEDDQQQSEGEDEGDEQQDQQSGEEGSQGDQDQEGEEDQEESAEDGSEQEEADAEDGETDQSGAGAENKADMRQNELSRQNIEAILQSLEDINREEQKSLMRSNSPTKIREGAWW